MLCICLCTCRCGLATKLTNVCIFIYYATHYHIVVSNESEAILQSMIELPQKKSNVCNRFITFSICFFLFRKCELRNTSDPSSGWQLSICKNKCSGLKKVARECLDETDFQNLLESLNYSEPAQEIVAWALNFDCYDPTTYAVPGVPISNTSCDNISFIDRLLPSSRAGELHVFAA